MRHKTTQQTGGILLASSVSVKSDFEKMRDVKSGGVPIVFRKGALEDFILSYKLLDKELSITNEPSSLNTNEFKHNSQREESSLEATSVEAGTLQKPS